MEKEAVEKFNRKLVILYIRQDSKSERYYVRLLEFGTDTVFGIDAQSRKYCFTYSAITTIYEMSARQIEKFEYIRTGGSHG